MARRLALLFVFVLAVLANAQERIQDVIYAKSAGAAFTMDVFKPKNPNGAGIIFVVSGGWFSSHEAINVGFATGMNNLGFTVFEVVHGAQPKYTIPEIAKLITRSVRFVRANASKYGVDPERLGITGGSAGGHLSLLTAGRGDDGDPNAKDPVDRQPSRVAAVVAIFPPTDFTDYGGSNPQQLLGSPMFAPFKPAFGIPTGATADQVFAIAKGLSPIFTVSAQFPPTLLIHGDQDKLVPLQQSETMLAALKKAGVACEIVVVKGGGHDAKTSSGGAARLVSWFQEKLKKKG